MVLFALLGVVAWRRFASRGENSMQGHETLEAQTLEVIFRRHDLDPRSVEMNAHFSVSSHRDLAIIHVVNARLTLLKWARISSHDCRRLVSQYATPCF
jgi:hypothetical protein